MMSIRTTIRGMYGSLYAVPEGKATDCPFLSCREDWRVCEVLKHMVVRNIPAAMGNKTHFSGEYFPGSPSKLGELNRGF